MSLALPLFICSVQKRLPLWASAIMVFMPEYGSSVHCCPFSLMPSNWQTFYSSEMLWGWECSLGGGTLARHMQDPSFNPWYFSAAPDSWSLNICLSSSAQEGVHGGGDALSTVFCAQQLMESCHLALPRMLLERPRVQMTFYGPQPLSYSLCLTPCPCYS